MAREVDTWRREAAFALDLAPEAALSLFVGDEERVTPRCVKLNNYWCIKRAGWAGEIAADGEGHVAFASAREGAAVAALLLKRYYVDFGLKTARAITARWAPAQCGGGSVVAGGAVRTVSTSLGGGLTRRGLGNTLRARWLASHTVSGRPKGAAAQPGTPQGAAPKASRTVMASGRTMLGPEPRKTASSAKRPPNVPRAASSPDTSLVIMAGAGAPSLDRFAVLPFAGIPMGPAPGGRSGALPPLSSCAGDSSRLAAYAARASDGVAAPDADLELFDGFGKPTANLAKVLANMAAVEIGPYRASNAVIAAGVAALVARLR